MKVHIDFETRSEADIFKVGAWNYSTHPSTEVLCAVFRIDDGEPILVTDKKLPEEIIELMFRTDVTFIAHNAFFEKAIWKNVCAKKYGWPDINTDSWRCTLARASVQALPRALGPCGQALELDVTKDEAGKKIMLKMAKLRPMYVRKGTGPKWFDDPEDYETLYKYCIADVEAESAIDNTVPDLSEQELKVWQLDQKINTRGVQIDIEAVKAALHLIGLRIDELKEETQALTNGQIESTSKRDQVLKWIREQGFPIQGYTKQEVIDYLKHPDIPANVKRILQIRQEAGKTSTAKYQKMLDMADEDGRVRDILLYHGASTGRWSGKGVQVQNMPRGSIADTYEAVEVIRCKDLDLLKMLYDNPMEVISSSIRSMFIASEGYKMYVADYASIEARVLAWLAGEQTTLDVFEKGGDVYKHAASSIYNKPASEITKDERQIGKVAVLALGYQGGVGAFQSMASSYGVDMTDNKADQIKKSWREAHPNIVSMWHEQERAAIQATLKPGKIVETTNKVKWHRKGKWLACRLPSGRMLWYYDPKVRIVETPWGAEKPQLTHMGLSNMNAWVRQETYGGKLVENITQAVARDIMAEAMLRCDAKGFDILMTIHDEIIAELPTSRTDTISQFEDLLVQSPVWADGLPLQAEGWIANRYRK